MPQTRSKQRFSCRVCENPDNETMVQCDNCDNWYHYECAGVNSAINELPWSCRQCNPQAILEEHIEQAPRSPIATDNHVQQENGNSINTINAPNVSSNTHILPRRSIRHSIGEESQRTSNGSRRSISTNQTRNSRIDLEIKRLDEEMRLREKRENEYLNKKYSILNQNEAQVDQNSEKSEYGFRINNWLSQTNKAQEKSNNIAKPEAIKNGLTKAQIAARQVMPKDLPPFSGNSEEWPVFYSNYMESTKVCGYTDYENLIRLQRSLKGNAMNAVRSRLLLPSMVPDVIETLKLLFGRPEVIIHNLLQKIRKEPPPKTEKLETIINYALMVKNLCGTMEAAELKNHLTNPMLLQELVDKLPAQIKLNWAISQQSISEVNLTTFSEWLFNMAKAASSVTLPIFNSKEVEASHRKSKEKAFVNSHAEGPMTNENEFEIEEAKTRTRICKICSGNCAKIESCGKFEKLNRSEKWQEVKKHKLCRKCLGEHSQFKCKMNKLCGKNGCQIRHHPLLHNDNTVAYAQDTIQTSCHTHQSDNPATLFRIIPVVLHNKNIQFETFAFLDEGSSLTLIEDELANELELNGSMEPLCLKWTGNTTRVEEDSRKVTFHISGKVNSGKRFKLTNVRTVKSLDLPTQTLDVESLVTKNPHLKGIPITGYTNAKARILIGVDNLELGIPLETKQGIWKQPIATKTRLGWTIYGTLNKYSNEDVFHSFHACECLKAETELHDMVKSFFALENEGVTNKHAVESKEDMRALKILEANTERKNGRFQTSLLWKYENVNFPENLNMATRRLLCLERKMAADPLLNENLHRQISEYERKGYARKLSNQEVIQTTNKTWYLPVFSVTNANKPEKVRLVWDAAAKVQGVSLNSMLLKGPDQLSSLIHILIRFREKRFAICGDIKEMFHQIRISEEDQQAQRFLWRKDPQKEPDVYVLQVMTFGATCSPSSAQFVKNKNAQEYSCQYPRAARAITENHYVDDLLDCMDTESEAIQLAEEVKLVHNKAGFEIRNWMSNSIKVLEALGEEVKVSRKNLEGQTQAEKVLGMFWCTTSDQFTFSLSYNKVNKDVLHGLRNPTKREVLRTLMSIYDPIGLIGHFLVYVKILLQHIWKSSIGWDEVLTDDLYSRWLKWIQNLPNIEKVKVPRCYSAISPGADRKIELHLFVDASQEAYAAVAYFRISKGEQAECMLVGSKTKVAPLKQISIPRLELQAAVLGVRLANTIKTATTMHIETTHYWSDSRTVLAWLKSDLCKYRQYVSLRVGEILENSEQAFWRWIPTKLNVADEATKWQRNPQFKPESRWFVGPDFLKMPPNCWPSDESEIPPPDIEMLKVHCTHIEVNFEEVVNPDRFSRWRKLLGTQVNVRRFINNLRCSRQRSPKISGSYTLEELRKAESDLYRQSQISQYREEMCAIANNQEISRKSSIFSLSPFIDSDGVLRAQGRIDAAVGVDEYTKKPIILPKKTKITNLIVEFYHQKYHHHNHETVVNEIRQKFYIPKLRSLLKTVRKNCQRCKNEYAKPHPPQMADLPLSRLSSFTRPFTFVGLDYFGPIYVNVGRRTEKRWGVIFTCLTVRAIHVEIAYSLTTDSCIMCIRNFMARRGLPCEIYSDNGTNLRGAEHELRKELKNLNQELLEADLTQFSTKWFFNPPAAPHMGGSWERLIRSFKNTLFKILPTRKLNDETLRNLFMETEHIINSRPLTYIPLDTIEMEALTPNHFLIGSSSGVKPPGNFSDNVILLAKNWKKSQHLADCFWKRWVMEYLPTITRRTKWFAKAKPIENGDLVIVVEEKSPRNTWKKGIVLKTILGRNNQVRQAIVKTSSGIYTRPAVKLAVLDVKK